jgi:UDP-glucuronate 4-epimerase
MHVLVTGSAGFIGFHTAKLLLDQGHTVVGMDNFNGYYSVALKRARGSQLRGRANFVDAEGDCTDFEFVNRVVRDQRVDVVCHLAAQPGVRHSVTHPFVCVHSNIDGFMSVVEACRQNRIGRLVYASSSSVYGANTKLPFSEGDRVDSPISLYGATKRANELMAHAYTHLYGIQTVGLRFFTVYGPWGRPDMAMWTFTEAMLEGRAIPVFNHGDMRRDFTFVADIAPAIACALSAEGLAPYEVLNLGNHRPESVMDVIRLISRELGVEPKIELRPPQPSDPVATFAETERARAKLGFAPATSIAEGIPQFVKWYKEYHRLGG